MPHLIPLGAEIGFVVDVGVADDRDRFDDAQAVASQADDLLRVVGEEAKLALSLIHI